MPKKGSDGRGATANQKYERTAKNATRPCSVPAGRIQEAEQRGRYLVILNEASAHLVGDVYSGITRPAFGGVEGDDAHRVFVLPCE
jgi:hypothetical protein